MKKLFFFLVIATNVYGVEPIKLNGSYALLGGISGGEQSVAVIKDYVSGRTHTLTVGKILPNDKSFRIIEITAERVIVSNGNKSILITSQNAKEKHQELIYHSEYMGERLGDNRVIIETDEPIESYYDYEIVDLTLNANSESSENKDDVESLNGSFNQKGGFKEKKFLFRDAFESDDDFIDKLSSQFEEDEESE